MSEKSPQNRDRLEGNEGQKFARANLVQVVVDDVNWKVLYSNPATGEYWKEIFPQSELQGGGPPVFVKISEEEAKREFKFD
jgi:hypothetical protein